MGCSFSNHPQIYSDIRIAKEVCKHKKDFDALGFSEEDIGKFYDIFTSMDLERSHTINFTELLISLKLDPSPFTKRAFTSFDRDESGSINFHECVLSIWNFCSLSEPHLAEFAFELYDWDQNQILNRTEVEQLLQDMYGKHFHTSSVAKNLLSRNVVLMSSEVTLKEFEAFCHEHSMLLFPAFELQRALRHAFLGTAFWTSMARWRLNMYKGKYTPLITFLKDNRKMFGGETAETPTEPAILAAKEPKVHKKGHKKVSNETWANGSSDVSEDHSLVSTVQQSRIASHASSSIETLYGSNPELDAEVAAWKLQHPEGLPGTKRENNGSNRASVHSSVLNSFNATMMQAQGRHSRQNSQDPLIITDSPHRNSSQGGHQSRHGSHDASHHNGRDSPHRNSVHGSHDSPHRNSVHDSHDSPHRNSVHGGHDSPHRNSVHGGHDSPHRNSVHGVQQSRRSSHDHAHDHGHGHGHGRGHGHGHRGSHGSVDVGGMVSPPKAHRPSTIIKTSM